MFSALSKNNKQAVATSDYDRMLGMPLTWVEQEWQSKDDTILSVCNLWNCQRNPKGMHRETRPG